MQLIRYLLLASVLAQPGYAAVLGDIQVQSALGERFYGRINVIASEYEELESRCFRIVAGHDDQRARLRVRLSFVPGDNGGELVLRGDEPLQEPLLNFSVRLHCLDEKSPTFQRDYNVLLDPREYQAKAGSRIAVIPPAVRRALPALPGIWQTAEGDSVERIARAYFPQDRTGRARMFDEIYRLNPDLAQNTRARLAPDTLIRLPSRKNLQAAAVGREEPAEEAVQAEAHQPTVAVLKHDSLQIAAPEVPAGPGGFHLRLSSPVLGEVSKSQLSPEDSLQARERLQLLESDDQTAQLLQFKYQISQLEKQLSSLQSTHSQDALPEARSEPIHWPSPWWLLLLLFAPLIWLVGRLRQVKAQDEFTLNDASYSTIAVPLPFGERLRDAVPGRNQVMGMVNNFSQAASDWSSDDVDVVQPKNVSEEAQMLLEHGLITQAINLLVSEIEQYPSALVLWMKLFDIYVAQGMRQEFQNRAVGFRLQFSSDSLWLQVQNSGRLIDADNPLYLSLDDNAPLLFEKEEPAIAGMEQIDFTAAVDSSEPGVSEAESAFAVDIARVQVEEVAEPGIEGLNWNDFQTDDPVLKKIVGSLKLHDIQNASHELEQLLYRGTMEQRQTAIKWLDILIPLQM